MSHHYVIPEVKYKIIRTFNELTHINSVFSFLLSVDSMLLLTQVTDARRPVTLTPG